MLPISSIPRTVPNVPVAGDCGSFISIRRTRVPLGYFLRNRETIALHGCLIIKTSLLKRNKGDINITLTLC